MVCQPNAASQNEFLSKMEALCVVARSRCIFCAATQISRQLRRSRRTS